MPVTTFAKSIVESKGKPQEDLQKYIDMLPENIQNDLIEDPEEKIALETRMKE